MCGIAVILPGSYVEVSAFAIERMTAALRHRGPDDQVCERLPRCHLGHTRLSVMDPANGCQPMTDPSGRFTVVFNGEIYNHRELRRELEREGTSLRTRCDTEVLLAGYARWGESVLSRLNGQFAFAVWDASRHTLFAARDRFGEKPLYWARTPQGHVLLASDVGAILASGLVRPRLDTVSVDAYLGLFYVPPDRSIYENIHPLPPAHAALWRGDGSHDQWRYWRPRYSCHDLTEAEAVQATRDLLAKAVERQTVADVPVGAFLSGGLDSTTIVGLMSGSSARPVRTFSVGFGDLIDELPFAREVAEAYGTEHHELQMDIDVAAMAERTSAVYDEPFADSSNIPTYLVAGHARRDVKVVLSGDGGDEIFGGYDWYRPLLASAGAGDARVLAHRHLQTATGIDDDRSALWGPRPQPAAAAAVRSAYAPGADDVGMDGAAAFDVACYLPGDILAKVDRAAMAHGLETRSPFLDVDLADFVIGLPWQMRFGWGARQRPVAAGEGGTPPLKRLLRKACGDLWPASVRGRGKQGFGAPVRHWLQRPDVNALWERVTNRSSPLAALLPGVRSEGVILGLRPQRKWTLLCLGLWLERRSECLASLS